MVHFLRCMQTVIIRVGWILVIGLSPIQANAKQQNYCNFILGGNDPCLMKIKDFNFRIRSDGVITTKNANNKTRKTAVPLPPNFYIGSAVYEVIGNKIIFIFDITDDESAGTLITLFDPTSTKFSWMTDLPFNPSPLLILNNAIYIGCIGTVVKLDALNGKILWKHENLYESETGAFNAFVKPTKLDSIIIFKEDKDLHARYKDIKEVRVDDLTGEILK